MGQKNIGSSTHSGQASPSKATLHLKHAHRRRSCSRSLCDFGGPSNHIDKIPSFLRPVPSTYYQSFSKLILLYNIIKYKMLRVNTVLSHPVRNSRLVEEWKKEEEQEDNRLRYPGWQTVSVWSGMTMTLWTILHFNTRIACSLIVQTGMTSLLRDLFNM